MQPEVTPKFNVLVCDGLPKNTPILIKIGNITKYINVCDLDKLDLSTVKLWSGSEFVSIKSLNRINIDGHDKIQVTSDFGFVEYFAKRFQVRTERLEIVNYQDDHKLASCSYPQSEPNEKPDDLLTQCSYAIALFFVHGEAYYNIQTEVYVWKLIHRFRSYLVKVQKELEKYYSIKFSMEDYKFEGNDYYKLEPIINTDPHMNEVRIQMIKEWFMLFERNMNTDENKIPDCIYNESDNTIWAFFLDGDDSVLLSMIRTSVNAAGLFMLLDKLKQRYIVEYIERGTRLNNPGDAYVKGFFLKRSFKNPNNDLERMSLADTEDQYFYRIETYSNCFMAGIGPVLLVNSKR